ncbi:MAG: hypothetical protein PHI97_31085 [Desulfobulbus sp.]|nr:hypothetical protein [Desulfobulbus sp.]
MKITEQLEEKRKLENRICEIRVALGYYIHIDNLQLAAAGKRNYADTLKKEKADKLSNVRVYAGDITLAEAEALEAEKVYNGAQTEKKQLEDEKMVLDAQLAKITIKCSYSELLEIQGEKEALAEKVDKIRTAIAAATANERPYLVEPDHPLSLLMEIRNALLADIAIGEPVEQQELDRIQDEIREDEGKLSEMVDFSIVQSHAIDGLNLKLAEAEERLATVDQRHRGAFFHYLWGEIESAGLKYTVMAQELGEVFTWIAAASDLLKQCGTPKSVLAHKAGSFRIPCLTIDDASATWNAWAPPQVFDYERVDKHAAVQDVVSFLDQSGIKRPRKVQ